MSKAGEICKRAAKIVDGDREVLYGKKERNFDNIAKLWSGYLDIPITAEQVAWMNVLQKCARTKTGSFNVDNFVDAAGFAGCAGEIAGAMDFDKRSRKITEGKFSDMLDPKAHTG